MRTKKATINSIVNVVNYLIMILPNFVIRKIFLVKLGCDLLGLNSLYQNIVGFLCISELGLSFAISYALYKPLAENNRTLIKAYLNYYTKFYRIVSLIIMITGILLLPFLKFFINGTVSNMKFYFILFLINTCTTYLFSAKFCLLSVSQQNYIISIVQTSISVISIILQIMILEVKPNYTLFLVIQITFNLVQMVILNNIINKKFNWLKHTKGNLEKEQIKSIFKNMKGLFFHKISAMVLFATDNIVISSFINLSTVALFNNYYLVISGAQSVIIKFFDGLTASVGNLLTEGDDNKSYDIFNKLFFIAFFIVSIISITLLNSINQFVNIWLGAKYKIDNCTILLLVLNFYFLGMRLPIEKFKETAGIYYEDRYMACLQAIINLVLSIILVQCIQLPGVFLGTFISNYAIEFWVKPKLVYKKVFKKDLTKYFIDYFKYYLIFIFTFLIVRMCSVNLFYNNNIISFICNCFLNICVTCIIYCLVFKNTKEFKYFKNLFFTKFFKKYIFKNKV